MYQKPGTQVLCLRLLTEVSGKNSPEYLLPECLIICLSSSTSAKIAALEAKLKAMEEEKSFSNPQRASDGRRRKRIPESRVIARPQKKSRTHRFRTRGPLI